MIVFFFFSALIQQFIETFDYFPIERKMMMMMKKREPCLSVLISLQINL